MGTTCMRVRLLVLVNAERLRSVNSLSSAVRQRPNPVASGFIFIWRLSLAKPQRVPTNRPTFAGQQASRATNPHAGTLRRNLPTTHILLPSGLGLLIKGPSLEVCEVNRL